MSESWTIYPGIGCGHPYTDAECAEAWRKLFERLRQENAARTPPEAPPQAQTPGDPK